MEVIQQGSPLLVYLVTLRETKPLSILCVKSFNDIISRSNKFLASFKTSLGVDKKRQSCYKLHRGIVFGILNIKIKLTASGINENIILS